MGEELLSEAIMLYIAVGVALFLWGALVGRVGRVLGTVLALIPVLMWIAVLAWSGWPGAVDPETEDALPAYLVIGLLAFFVGVNLTSRSGTSRREQKDP